MFVRFLFFSTLFFFSFGIFGDPLSLTGFPYFSSRSWNAASGLPHNSATSFYRDENGLVWVGTVEGLVRIDSKSSEIFNTSTSSAILSNKIDDLSGCKGKVFVATPMGISEISGFGKKISKVSGVRGVFDIEAFSDCTLFATDGKDLMMIKSNKINKLSESPDFPESSVSSIFSDASTLYAGFENGEIRSFGGSDFSGNLCPANSSAVTSGKAKEGRVLFGNADGAVFEIKEGKCAKIAKTDTRKSVTSLDFQGETVVFAADGSLFFAENPALKPCGNLCSEAGSVSRVMLDGSFVWLSGSRGLTLFYPGKFITLGRESGLFSEKVYALMEDNSGRIWAGTRGGGLFYYENGRFRYLKDRKGDIGRFVGGLFQNDDGGILVGTTSGIVSFVPEKPSVFRKMKTERPGDMESVGVIFRDRKSRLWAGGGGGAIYLNTKNGWHLLRKFGDDSDFVSAIAEDGAGNLWFAASKGLWQLNTNNEFHEINQGVEGNVPVSLYVDENDVVFVGSMHRGLTLIFPDLKPAQLDSRKGLCSDMILGIVSDESGNLWFSSTNGIFSLPKSDVIEAAKSENGLISCTPFDSSDGIRRPESTGGVQPSVLKRKNGDLWFPTLEGIAVLQKNGRKPAKFETVLPEEKANIVDKNEEKSNSWKIFPILAVLAAVLVIFVVRRPHPDTIPHPQPLSSVARGEEPDPSAAIGSSPTSVEPENAEEDLTPGPLSLAAAPDPSAASGSSPASGEPENGEDSESEPENTDVFDPAEDETGEKQKYEKNRLDDEIAEAYAKELKELMETKKLYRNPDLTLPDLAKKLKLTTNILSQVLNGCCGQSFYNFVNTYRVNEVIAMMNDPKHENDSILKISFEAGFKSKSSFNTIFKKLTGLTPSEYRRNLEKESEKQ